MRLIYIFVILITFASEKFRLRSKCISDTDSMSNGNLDIKYTFELIIPEVSRSFTLKEELSIDKYILKI